MIKTAFITVAIKKSNSFYHKVVFSLTSSASTVFSHDTAEAVFFKSDQSHVTLLKRAKMSNLHIITGDAWLELYNAY